MIGLIVGVVLGLIFAIPDHRGPNVTCRGYWRCPGTYFIAFAMGLVGMGLEVAATSYYR